MTTTEIEHLHGNEHNSKGEESSQPCLGALPTSKSHPSGVNDPDKNAPKSNNGAALQGVASTGDVRRGSTGLLKKRDSSPPKGNVKFTLSYDSDHDETSNSTRAIHVTQNVNTVYTSDYKTTHLYRQDSILIKVKPGQCFTRFADVRVESPSHYDPRLGMLGELRHLMRTGTKSQVKKFIRTHNWPIGHRIRAELWKELSSVSINLDAQRLVYRDELKKLELGGYNLSNPKLPALHSHAGPVIKGTHMLNPYGLDALKRVVIVLEKARPDITHIPYMHPVCALFLHYMNEEDAFACLMRLLTSTADKPFLTQTDISASATKRTLVMLMKKHTSRVYQLFRRAIVPEGTPVENEEKFLVPVFEEWRSWIFRDLPLSHVVRITDCYLFEGIKVLFRAVLAILTLWNREHGQELKHRQQVAPEMLRNEISSFCKTLPTSVPRFLKASFGIRNFKSSTILRLQERYEIQLRAQDPQLNAVASELNMKKVLSIYNFDVKFPTKILSLHQGHELMRWTPHRFHLCKPIRLFSMSEDGTSFTTFWRLMEDYEPTLLVVQTGHDEVFGAFLSTACNTRKTSNHKFFFGTGETFLFRFPPPGIGEGGPEKFAWVGMDEARHPLHHNQELFVAAENSSLTIGGGGGEGLSFRDSLEKGTTERCLTFENPPLTALGHFSVKNMEVFALVLSEYEE